MTPDSELLHQYAEKGDEAAFTELVRRHLNMVYATAVRLLNGDDSLAQDVTQSVFTDLARKADLLARRDTVAGWLHTSVRYAASSVIRTEQRRRTHEQEASDMNDSTTNDQDLAWMQLRPLIDEAIGELQGAERDAVLLRYFEEKSHREVASVLGLNENAARMRVDRAVDKLRDYYLRRGITTTGALLASTLGAKAASSPAPAAFAVAVAGQALLGVGVKEASGTVAGSWILSSLFAKIFVGVFGVVSFAAVTTAILRYAQSTQPDFVADAPKLKMPAAPAGEDPAKLPGPDPADNRIVFANSVTAPGSVLATTPSSTLVETINAPGMPITPPSPPVSPNRSSSPPADATAPPVSALPAANARLHDFINQQGEVMRAEVLSVSEPNAMLKLDSGETILARIAGFGPEDQAYIRAQASLLGSAMPALNFRTGIITWGLNTHGQLGNGKDLNDRGILSAPRGAPRVSGAESVDLSGALNGKTVAAIASGDGHRLALCTDGTLVAWGDNSQGALGNGTKIDSAAPVLVNTSYALKGKSVIAIAAGGLASLALTSDGAVFVWGGGAVGSESESRTASRTMPVQEQSGALAGRKVIAIAAGTNHALALCSDGALVAWGFSSNNKTGEHQGGFGKYGGLYHAPVQLNDKGALKGKIVSGLAANGDYSLAHFTDGTSAVWGRFNAFEPSDLASSSPVDFLNPHSVLKDKVIAALADDGPGGRLVLCVDGTLAVWPRQGEVAAIGGDDRGDAARGRPVLVDKAGSLKGKTVAAISQNLDGEEAGGYLILCTDGTLLSWSKSGVSPRAATVKSAPVVARGFNGLKGKTILALAPGMILYAEPIPLTEGLAKQ